MKKNRSETDTLLDLVAGELGLDDDALTTVAGGITSLRLGAETFCDYTCSSESCCSGSGSGHLR